MTTRSFFLLAGTLLLCGCLTPVADHTIGAVDGGSTGGGGAATGGGAPTGGGATGGGAATGGGGGATGGGNGGGNAGTVTCSSDGFCWERAPYGGTFHAVSGAGPNFVVAVGEGGVVATWNGTQWTYAQSPTRKALRGVWLDTATHGFAVGDEGTVLELNGTTWSLFPINTTADLTAVHGVGETIFVGGVDVLFRWVMVLDVGPEFQPITGVLPVTDSQAVVRRIRVVSDTDAYLVGSGGTNFFLRYDGTGWVDMFGSSPSGAPTSSDPLYGLDVCGSSLFVGGSYSGEGNASWARYQGTWETSFTQGARVACLSDSEYLAFGASFFNNETVSLITLGVPSSTTTISERLRVEDAWVAGARDAWLVGANGALLHWTGGALASNSAERTSRVFAFSASDVWAVRGDDNVERFDGSTWAPVSIPGSGVILDLYAPSRDEVWVVRQGWVVHHFVNGAWQVVGGFPSGTTWVRGSSASNVWFSGGEGVVMQWNGATLTSRFLPAGNSTGPMHVTATQTWVPTWSQFGVGSSYQWTGASFASRDLGWRISGSGDDVYFIGVGALYRFTGTASVLITEGVGDLLAASSDALYAISARYGAAGQTNGLVRVAMGTSQVTPIALGSTEQLSSLSATADGHVWATTVGGGLLHKRP